VRVALVSESEKIPWIDDGAIVQVGAGAPQFYERRRIKNICRPVPRAARANVVLFLVGEHRRRMAFCAMDTP